MTHSQNDDIMRILALTEDNEIILEEEEAFSLWDRYSLLEGRDWAPLPDDDDTLWIILEDLIDEQKDIDSIKSVGGDIYYLQDCKAIIYHARRHDISITIGEAYELWSEYSQNHAAGWMTLNHVDDPWLAIQHLYTKEPS